MELPGHPLALTAVGHSYGSLMKAPCALSSRRRPRRCPRRECRPPRQLASRALPVPRQTLLRATRLSTPCSRDSRAATLSASELDHHRRQSFSLRLRAAARAILGLNVPSAHIVAFDLWHTTAFFLFPTTRRLPGASLSASDTLSLEGSCPFDFINSPSTLARGVSRATLRATSPRCKLQEMPYYAV